MLKGSQNSEVTSTVWLGVDWEAGAQGSISECIKGLPYLDADSVCADKWGEKTQTVDLISWLGTFCTYLYFNF